MNLIIQYGLLGLVLGLGLGLGFILYCKIWCPLALPYMCPQPYKGMERSKQERDVTSYNFSHITIVLLPYIGSKSLPPLMWVQVALPEHVLILSTPSPAECQE